MYYVFNTELCYWRNHMVQASFEGQILDFKPSWWFDAPLNRPIPPLIFTVSSKAPKPDNLFVGTAFSLYSTKLVELIEKADVRFEGFPATLLDRKTRQILPYNYMAFHLLELQTAIDREHSVIEDNTSYIGKLVLTKECIEASKPLFRVKDYLNLVLIHENLKTALEASGITGCVYTPVEKYQAGVEFRDILGKQQSS